MAATVYPSQPMYGSNNRFGSADMMYSNGGGADCGEWEGGGEMMGGGGLHQPAYPDTQVENLLVEKLFYNLFVIAKQN